MLEALERLRNRCGLARLPRAYDDLDESSLLVDSIYNYTYIAPFISHYDIPISQILYIISQILRDSKNKAACHYREVVAISHSPEKAELAKKLGANHYIATANGDAAEQLKALGGAKVMLVTADKPKLIKPLIGGLALGGEMILAATSMEAIGWSTMDFIGGVASVKGTFTDAGELAASGRRPLRRHFPASSRP